jgi:gliding motility-associated-like protein
MRAPHLLIIFLVLLTFPQSKLFSQISSNLVAPVFSLDSLQGFDENLAKQNALNEGFYGQQFIDMMQAYKRQFVINKYDLYAKYNDPSNFATIGSTTFGKYSSGITANAPCTNEDFENGTLSGWTASLGLNVSSQTYPTTNTSLTIGPYATVVTTPYTDPVLGFTVPNSPLGGSKVAIINTASTTPNQVTIKLSQTFSVTATNYLYDFAYLAVMQDAPNHSCLNTPYMAVRIRNFTGTLQACPNFSIVAPSTGFGGCAGIGPTTWSYVATGGGFQINTGWQKFSIDLTPYMSQNVTVEIIVADCALGGHYGYAYFDSNCNTMNLTVNGTQTLSMPNTTVTPQVLCGTNATLTAPSGLSPYSWSGPPGSGVSSNTNQSISTSVAGSYTLNMSPTGICNPPITKIVNLSFVPPATITASSSNLCATGTNTSSTLVASGATSYTWAPGGSTLSTIVVTPTVTTIYTLTAKTGSCLGTFTTQITVNPDPSISVVSSNFSVCPGQSATLTAFGGNSYAWNPGALSGNIVVVSPLTTTSYTTTGTSTAGCTGTVSTTIVVSAPLALSILTLSPTYICPGTAVNMVAGGATTFTWLPNNVTGFFQSFTPTITTTYTVIGASGACTASTNITVTVDPGPSMTVTPNPTITCPGNTTTLSVISPGAVGAFTWNPGATNGSSIVVTPTLAGGYSVSAVDAMGCKNTQTINPNFSPLPNIVISPSAPSICAGSSSTLTASGGVSYTWMPGNLSGATAVVSPASNTTYTITGANASGCVNQATVMVTVVPIPTINASASPTAVCAGSCATITPGGASTYTIQGGSFIVCPLVNTTYTLSGTNAAGCTSNTIAVALTVNSLPIITASANPASICSGGSSTLSAGGAVSYTWSTGSNTFSTVVTPTATQNFGVSGTNAFGCIGNIVLTVTVNPLPNITITPSSPTICPGGTVAPVASGATSYTWNPGGLTGSSVVLSPLGNTIYTVTGNTGGCTGQNTVLITVAPSPTITASFSPPSICAGSCATLSASGVSSFTMTGLSAIACPTTSTNYTVVGSNASGCISNQVAGTLSVTNGPLITASSNPASICPGDSSHVTASGALSYTWQPGNIIASSFYAKPASTTVYTVTGTNASGCTSTATTTVVVNSIPVVVISPAAATICPGTSANLTASGATTYTWLPGNIAGSSIAVSPTISTTYTAIGANGSCNGQNTVLVTVAPVPVISGGFNPPVICAGSCATLAANGAASYTISGGLSAIACPTITTNYTVTGSNAFGCISNALVGTLTVNAVPILAASASPTSICPGDSSMLTTSGALSYTWQPVNLNGSSVIVHPVASTVYTASGTNAAGCIGSQTVSVIVIPTPTILASASPTSICSGGSATLSASGAGNYVWMPGALSGPNVFVAPTVTTTYTVTGNTGSCSGFTVVTLVVNPIPTVNITASALSICQGGTVSISLTGASTYSWNDGSNAVSRVVSPTVTTTYSILGFGSTGCTSNLASITITVNGSPNIIASASPSNICSGTTSTLSASGATSYLWQPVGLVGSTLAVTPAVSTIYTVTGTGAAGCSSTATVSVVVGSPLSVTASSSSSVICAGNSAVLSATSAGATGFTWLPGVLPSAGTITVSPLVATVYTVTATNGACSAQATVSINVSPSINVSISAPSSFICSGNCTTLTASGAGSYTWSTGSTINPLVVCPATSTNYAVLGSSGSCTSNAVTFITVNSVPVLSVTGNPNPVCSGASATITASGAGSYTWNTGANTSNIVVTPLANTVYTVVGSNGACSSTLTYTQNVNFSPSITIIASSPSVCAGFTTALLALGAPSFTWLPSGSTNNPLIITPLSTTIYTATASSGGCASSATVNIAVVPLPNVSLTANPQTLCAGNTTTLTASGAVTYSWIPSLAGGSTFTASPSATTVYTVVGFNSSGCPNFDTVAVSVVQAPTITIVASSASVCSGSSATLSANGALNYTWNPGSQTGGTIVVAPTVPTVYTVTGNNGGCSGTAFITIGINTAPLITASVLNATICAGDSVSLSASGGLSYTWNPTGQNGSVITDHPVNSTTYTVMGANASGCPGSATVALTVNALPVISAVANPSTICNGAGTVTLTASGALNYTWNPNGQMGSTITETPNVSTVYTVSGTDANGCKGLATVPVNVVPTPTLSVSPLNSSVCLGTSATLTANGAANYTWLPSGSTSSITVETPVAQTTYTLIGSNGGLCFSTYTVNVFVNPLPSHIGATSTGTVSCSSPSVYLFGTCADTNITYSWAGPQGYTTAIQNPTVLGIWGTFTLNVISNITGCIATTTVIVPTDNSIPLVNPVASGSITCAVSIVTLNAVNTTTNPAYSWIGPGNFTSTIQSPTVTMPGNYTITVKDLSSTCSSTAMVSVGIHTRVEITGTITPATCEGGSSLNDGKITLSSFIGTDKYDLVSGLSYTGTATYTTAALIPTTGVITNNLANPSTTVAYTLRLFDAQGCVKDTTLFLIPVDCSFRTLGVAKAVSLPLLNSDGSYNLTYTVVVKNYDKGTLSNISLTENLSNTFPSPTTFTVFPDSTKISSGSGLLLNKTGFDGLSQTNLLASGTNTLASGNADTIQFTLKVKTGLFFIPFRNTVLGSATNAGNNIMSDSSNTGLDPDPDNDNDPYNHNVPTVISFSPGVFFGITKSGEIHKIDNDSYDVSYTITVYNRGNDTIRNITLHDSLFGKTIKNPVTYSMRSNPVSSGNGLIANTSFDGNTVSSLVIPSQSKMSPNTTSSIYFSINIVPGTVTAISNSAYGNALCAKNATESVIVSDTSNAGTNPDVNGNGIANEASDNMPTILLVPITHTLFIPEGFSPNGDNINDLFVIQGLPETGENAITIFNRWGNKVYQHSNYNNSWDGTPNVSGTLGKDKLPQGTYYYVLDLKDSGIKPIAGFVILQY